MPTRMIRLILLDGDPEGLRSASMAGRTTVLIGGPWPSLKQLISRPEAKRPGVYFLIGAPLPEQENEGFAESVYIGECDSLEDRFGQGHHRRNSADWSQIFFATTTEGAFNKAHARVAEDLLVARARNAKRVAVLTQRTSPVSVDEGDLAFSEEFVANTLVLAQTLGVSLFRLSASVQVKQLDTTLQRQADENEISVEPRSAEFRFSYTNDPVDARMLVDGSEFVIIAGSRARREIGKGLSQTILAMRKSAEAIGILVPDDDARFLKFTQDYPTSSTSAAGSMVYGSSCAGPIAWKNVLTGQTYKDWAENKV